MEEMERSELPLWPVPESRRSNRARRNRNTGTSARNLLNTWDLYAHGPREEPKMSALAVAPPHASRPRLHPVPDLPREIAEPPVTVTISIAGAAAGRDRVLAVLRDLVDVAGSAVSVELEPSGGTAPADGIRLDPRARTAPREGRSLELSRLEFDLLLFLARHPRQVFSRTQLL